MKFTIVRTYLHIYNFHYRFVYIFCNLMSRLRSYFHNLLILRLFIALQENVDHLRTRSGQNPFVTMLGTVTSVEPVMWCDSHVPEKTRPEQFDF